jgi:hypothetical protein
MALAGAARAKSFSWRQAAERVLAVFDEVIPNTAASTPIAATRS